MYVCVTHERSAFGQKRALGPEELELQIVRCHVGDDNQTLVLWKNSECS